jgi:alanyl-tRNA synthetase
VAPDYLRFDFTHFKAVDPAALASAEALVNEEVRKNILLDKRVMSKEEAVKQGAIAFFGEKYGDEVRVVAIGDFSKELCGGTHLHSTGEIELFKITSESSIQAGVRRIEAVTGRAAKSFLEKQQGEVKSLSDEFACNAEDLPNTLVNKKNETNQLRSRLEAKRNEFEKERLEKEKKTAEVYHGVSILSRSDDKVHADLFSASINILKSFANYSFVALFEGVVDEKAVFAIGASSDLVQKGFHSGKIIKLISEKVGGNGGGRPEYAVGGGKNISKAKEAFAFGKEAIKKELDSVLAAKKAS